MTGPANGYVRASKRTVISIKQPVKPTGHQTVTGTLLGAMHDRGAVLHYRVALEGGVVLLAPPEWLHRDSRIPVVRAGLDVPDHIADGMWVETINRLAAAWADSRAERTQPENVV